MHGLAVFEHEGGSLLFHQLDDGRVACKARDLGRALGYGADGKNLIPMIRREWADEFEEGVDFVISKSLDLFRVDDPSTLEDAGNHSESFRVVYYPTLNPRGEMMLTREGVNIVCIKTDKPVGKVLRRWLAREVLPALHHDGAYTMPGVAQDGPGEAGRSPLQRPSPRRPQPPCKRLPPLRRRSAKPSRGSQRPCARFLRHASRPAEPSLNCGLSSRRPSPRTRRNACWPRS